MGHEWNQANLITLQQQLVMSGYQMNLKNVEHILEVIKLSKEKGGSITFDDINNLADKYLSQSNESPRTD